MKTVCVLCKQLLDDGSPTVRLREKGCEGIKLASTKRNDDITVIPGQIVHSNCRKDYSNINAIKRDTIKSLPNQNCFSPKLRSESETFHFKNHCLFCGQHAKYQGNKRGSDVRPVMTLQFQASIRELCRERGDDWSMVVLGRLSTVSDLPAADAVYHQKCSVNFRTMKDIPAVYSQSGNKRSRGRPTDFELEESFQVFVQYIENCHDEQITIRDLVDKMKENIGDNAYSAKYMKQKLQEQFGDSLVISEKSGKVDVVTLQPTANSILHEFFKRQKNEDSEAKRIDIIKTVGKIIKSDICSLENNYKTVYPSPSEVSSIEHNLNFLPNSLKILLQELISQKDSAVILAAIGQAIVQATRPRSILAPLQVGLGVQLHHQFASKFLIETLNTLGFCSSYSEIQKFESNAALAGGNDIHNLKPDSFIQYIADNVDHNVRTLDGHGTFHGMGIIACVTPSSGCNNLVKRSAVTKNDILAAGEINISYYTQNESVRAPIQFEELGELRKLDPSRNLESLIRLTWSVRPFRSGWSGIMHLVQNGDFPGMSSVEYLPMIDLPPTDMSCIYTTLKFVSDHASKHGVCPILTFDQPLYWKALTIVLKEPLDSDLHKVILRLGGFHILMSFLGSIAYLTQGSGLVEVLETVYASNAVTHMMSGKAVSRAIRGHSLVDRALSSILMREIFNVPLPECENDNVDMNKNEISEINVEQSTVSNECENVNKLGEVFDDLISGKIDNEAISQSDLINDMHNKFIDGINGFKQYRTGSLWAQYIEMVQIMNLFIKAERTGDWDLYLYSLSCMLPFFAASGHNLYLKSVYVYLQMMTKLETFNKRVYQSFKSGYHVIRRSNRFWAGLSPDLVIEQVLMRSVKTNGGLTRGKGIGEIQRTQWLLSLPSCAKMNAAVQSLCGAFYQTSEQHKEHGDSRQKRDHKDSQTIMRFLTERNPFTNDTTLRNIDTGVAADKNVNVDNARQVGQSIVEKMIGKNVMDFTFKKSQQVVVLNNKNSNKLTDDTIQIDPQILFQRLTTAVSRSHDDISNTFQYELCSIPSSIFEPSGLPRLAQKSSLADAIWSLGDCSILPDKSDNLNVQHVLDGGSLLHRIPWQQGKSYGEICQSYVDFIRKRQYEDPVIVFDGYRPGPSTKDVTHIRRCHGITGTNVSFKETTSFKGKKETFLINSENKQNFVTMLGESFIKNGFNVLHANGDADLLIVKTAVDCSNTRDVMLIGEDTDLLVLLLYHANINTHNVYFKSQGRQYATKNVKLWDIRKTKSLLGHNICSLLPFLHALTGCDTTSRLFGIGKAVALKKLSDSQLQNYGNVFNLNSSLKEVEVAGENALILLYGGVVHESLNVLRFKKFSKKISSNYTSSVQVQNLPPTSAAAKFHSLRVYYQVQDWIHFDNPLVPSDWGWNVVDNKYIPIMTDLPPAPDDLLKIIKCNCKLNCETRKCSCRNHGLDCSISCGECRGIGCSNVSKLTDAELQDDQSDDFVHT